MKDIGEAELIFGPDFLVVIGKVIIRKG